MGLPYSVLVLLRTVAHGTGRRVTLATLLICGVQRQSKPLIPVSVPLAE